MLEVPRKIATRESERENIERPSTKEQATFAERHFGPVTTRVVLEGVEDPEKYESFTIQKFEWTDENVMWINFLGLGNVQDVKEPNQGLSFVPGLADLIPKQGTSFVFNGPSGIAGYTPEQCIRCTEAVMQAVFHLAETYPNKKIRIRGFSSGTHLATYAANQLGKRYGKAIDRLEIIAGGESIAYGIYSTWVTDGLARDLEGRGITKESYDKAIAQYTQRENIDYLPAGRNLVIHAGTADTFIPMDKKGGTDDWVDRLRKKGKHPAYVRHERRDHVTLPLAVILEETWGEDPSYLRQNRDAWENEATFNDEIFMKSVRIFLSRFTENGQRAIAQSLAKTVGNTPEANIRPHERAVAKALVQLGICSFAQSPDAEQSLLILGEFKADQTSKKRKEAEENLKQTLAFVKEIGTSDIIVPEYEVQKFSRAA